MAAVTRFERLEGGAQRARRIAEQTPAPLAQDAIRRRDRTDLPGSGGGPGSRQRVLSGGFRRWGGRGRPLRGEARRHPHRREQSDRPGQNDQPGPLPRRARPSPPPAIRSPHSLPFCAIPRAPGSLCPGDWRSDEVAYRPDRVLRTQAGRPLAGDVGRPPLIPRSRCPCLELSRNRCMPDPHRSVIACRRSAARLRGSRRFEERGGRWRA